MADTQLAIRQEDITQITEQAPESFNLNRLSHDKCLAYGEDLLRYIEQNGMNEENDNRLNDYIKKCRATVKAMNERRTPVTQLFDRFRNLYTTMENGISPSTPGTPANRAQKMRDDFARKKHEEAERARKEAERQQRIAQARNSYKEDCERELFNFFNTRTNQAINRISELNRSIELSTFDAAAAEIQAFDCSFPVEDIARYTFGVMIPSCLELKECQEMQRSVLEKAKAMADQYRFDVSDYRDSVTASLPSKFNELKAIEEKRKTDAAEAARREQELKSKEDEERQKMEAERKAKEDKERQMKSMEHEQQAVAGMFSTAATTMATAPGKKVKIRKAVKVRNMKGYADLFTFWWVGEGQFMSSEELEKIFKKQFTYAEKQANAASPEFIKSDNVEYVDDVKAK